MKLFFFILSLNIAWAAQISLNSDSKIIGQPYQVLLSQWGFQEDVEVEEDTLVYLDSNSSYFDIHQGKIQSMYIHWVVDQHQSMDQEKLSQLSADQHKSRYSLEMSYSGELLILGQSFQLNQIQKWNPSLFQKALMKTCLEDEIHLSYYVRLSPQQVIQFSVNESGVIFESILISQKAYLKAIKSCQVSQKP